MNHAAPAGAACQQTTRAGWIPVGCTRPPSPRCRRQGRGSFINLAPTRPAGARCSMWGRSPHPGQPLVFWSSMMWACPRPSCSTRQSREPRRLLDTAGGDQHQQRACGHCLCHIPRPAHAGSQHANCCTWTPRLPGPPKITTSPTRTRTPFCSLCPPYCPSGFNWAGAPATGLVAMFGVDFRLCAVQLPCFCNRSGRCHVYKCIPPHTRPQRVMGPTRPR